MVGIHKSKDIVMERRLISLFMEGGRGTMKDLRKKRLKLRQEFQRVGRVEVLGLGLVQV